MQVEHNTDSAAGPANASPPSADQEPPTTLILVRHGETESNVQQVWYGAMDAPLTERGRLQVASTGERMAVLNRRYPADVFYVSPLSRAQSTAAAIAEAIGMEPLVEEGLREFDLGDWEGRSFQDLRETENLWGRWAEDAAFAPPNGESPASFHVRVMQAMQALVARHPGQTVLMVTHGALLSNVLATWLGDGPQDWKRWDPPNCAITVLQSNGSRWNSILLNDVSHLPPEGAAKTPDY